jgi:UDP-N-acetylglucosamine enolpyruvyl transferase
VKNTFIPIAFVSMLATAGCASSFPVPTQKLADAESANRSARELGAEKKTDAQLNLKLADEEIEAAKVQMKNGDNRRAEYILLRAKADAELALALAREHDAKVETVKAVDTSNAKTNATQNANGGQ